MVAVRRWAAALAALGGLPITSTATPTTTTSITKVHLVQSNHLDVGFTGSITGVLNEYFDTYLPAAVNISAELRLRGGEEQLVFTTHAYLLSLFLDCPLGRGLHCPNASAVSAVEGALRDGSLALHAFPFNRCAPSSAPAPPPNRHPD